MGRIVVRPAGYTGFLQQLTWVQGNNVPVTAHLWGGAGGGGGNDSNPGGAGSGGGYTQTQFTINEGDVLEVAVGGPGTGGAGGRSAAGGTPGSSYLVDASLLFSTLETASPPVFRQFNSAYCTFLNTYGVWVNPTSARTFDRTYTINFPVETWYTFSASADNYADIYLDGVLLFAATSFQGVGTNGYYLAAGTKQVRIVGTNTGGPGAVALTIGGAANFAGSFGGFSGESGSSGAGGGGGGATVVLLNGSALGAAGGGGGGGGGGNTGTAAGQSAPGNRGQAAVGTNEGQNGTNKSGDGGGGGGGGGGWGGGNGGTVPGGDQGGYAGVYGGSSGASENPNGRFPGGSSNQYYRGGIATGGAGGGNNGSAGYAVFEFNVAGTLINLPSGGFEAASNTWIKINGAWTRVTTPYVKQGGIWYPINGYAPVFENVSGKFGASPRAAIADAPVPSPYEEDRGGWEPRGCGWTDTTGGAGADGGADCFTADSLVSMADGSSCRIADVKIGDHVVNHNGSGVNCVKFIEIAMDTRWGQLYSPNDHMLPFATINHPLYIGDQLCSVDPEQCYNMYPWLGKTQKLSTMNIEPAKGVPVYNLWVDGDGTYTANGYGTTSIIGDGSFVTACFEKGYLTVEDVLTQVGYFADHGKYVQYGAVLINKLLKHSNIEWVNKLIAGSIKNGNYSKKIIKLFAHIVGYIAHPNK